MTYNVHKKKGISVHTSPTSLTQCTNHVCNKPPDELETDVIPPRPYDMAKNLCISFTFMR